MVDAAKNNNRVLEIGYQRYYNPIYQAAYKNIIKQGLLGDIYHARLAVASQLDLAQKRRSAGAKFRPQQLGLSRLGTLLELAHVPEVLRRIVV